MLAQYRCDEISAEVFGKFSEAVKHFQREIEGGKIFGSMGQEFGGHRKTAIGRERYIILSPINPAQRLLIKLRTDTRRMCTSERGASL